MKTLTATHTPTPILLTIVSESATHVAFINGPTYSREEIIRAVNCHEELLEALKNYAQADWHKGNIDSEHYRSAMQAIAKAEGKL